MPNPVVSLRPLDISTRPKRRRAVVHIINALGRIYSEEDAYLNRIPLNLQGSSAYAAADDSLSYLIDAINALSNAYFY